MKRCIPLLAILMALVCPPSPAAEPVLALKAGRVFDSRAGRVGSAQVILVEKGRISAMGPGLAIPDGATVIDLSGYTVMPGLIEAHAHLLQEHPGDEHNTLTVTKAVAMEGDPLRALRGAARARSYLEAGYTTVRDLGNAGRFADVALKRAIDEGSVPGPRLFVSGPGLAPEGGQVPNLAPGHAGLIDGDYRIVRGAEDARIAVRENVYHGADLIKIYSNSSPNRTLLSLAEMKAIVEEAHLYKLKVTAHATTDEAIERALEAGVDAIEHGYKLSDTTLRQMQRKGVFLVPTDMDVSLAEKQVRKLNMPLTREQVVGLAKPYHERLRRARDTGVTIAAGSDMYMGLGPSRGEAAKRVLFAYAEAGLGTREILQAATINNARLLDQEGLGVLAEGAHADIIAVHGNPLDELAAIERVVFVMKAGVVAKALPR
ncbi:amidohydrolase family protein [Massilia sp. IC2-476]|uniref:amidohydrolase family protein n=1 Tax=Massilia sp. IC2-476 TaxID=2887199 RepID=UPI001D101650|nr:amidohydrolase family protein [Massilia sp. IC2-476]MCC2971845.1 amidohydrolase family protein [Massilia sp. IC2-476]